MEQDEINLVDYIEVIIKRKKLIVFFFLCSVFIMGIFIYMQPKVYEAVSSMLITPFEKDALFSDNALYMQLDSQSSEAKKYLSSNRGLSLATHKVMLKSSIVLERVLDRLKASEDFSAKFIPVDLNLALEIDEIKDANIFLLKAKSINSQMAKKMVDLWGEEYTKYNQELLSGVIKGTGDFISEQFDMAEKNLFKAEEELKELNNKQDVDLIQDDVTIKIEKLNTYKKEMLELSGSLKSKEDELRVLKEQIAKQDKFFIISKAVTDETLWREEAKSKGKNLLDNKKLKSEEVNPIYQALEKRIVDTEIRIDTMKPRMEYLSELITGIEKDVNESQRIINECVFKQKELKRNVEVSKNIYDDFSGKIKEARMIKTVQLGEVRIISSATYPQYPIGMGRREKAVLAIILSLILSVFSVFFIDFWQKIIPIKRVRAFVK